MDQGLPYWKRFMDAFPNVADLAQAPEEKVLRLWQGLGYYSRARNLHHTAKTIAFDLGSFPSTYDEILKLKGIGPYTAAAIASICFDEAKPVVDGNVFRFASRYFGILDDTSKTKTRRTFEKALSDVIPASNPGDFNQAMMEFGATVCTPSPKCESCILRMECYAFAKNKQQELPVKTGKTKVRDRHFQYIVLKHNDQWLMKARSLKDVWQELYDFFLIEGEADEEQTLQNVKTQLSINDFEVTDVSGVHKHILSHQRIYARFYLIHLSAGDFNRLCKHDSLKAYSNEEVLNLPKPKLIVNYLQRIGFN